MRVTVAPVAAAVVGLVAAGAVVLPMTRAEAVGPGLQATPTNPVLGESVTFSGRLPARLSRPISLQRWSGSAWVAVTTGRVGGDGTFTLAAKMPHGPVRFRAYAPKASGSAAQTTATRTLTAATPSGTVSFTAAPVGQAKAGTTDLTPVQVRFSPPRTGRKVELQRGVDGTWVRIAGGTLTSGAVTFQVAVPAGDSRAYRAVAAGYRGAASVTTPGRTATRWKQVFADEFSGSALDLDKWSYRAVGVRDGHRLCAVSSPSSVSVSGGHLKLQVKATPSARRVEGAACPYGQFDNGHISTAGKFDFKHGIMAARIRFPAAAGQHGSLWSQPSPGGTGSEIDVVEHFGANSKLGGLAHNIYWHAADELTTVGHYPDLNDLLLPAGDDWSDAYHVYSVEWTPTRYVFRVDGKETFRATRGVSRAEQYVILSLLTSDWELPRFDLAKAGAMSVDWVRVWQG